MGQQAAEKQRKEAYQGFGCKKGFGGSG